MTTSHPNLDFDRLAASLFDIASAIEAQEQRIKRCLLRAAKQGDIRLVQELMELWLANSAESAAEFVQEAQPQVSIGRTNPAD